MSLKKLKLGSLITVLFVVLVSRVGQAFVFTDPTELYSTTIWDQWVYQSHHSNDQITVFYGEGDYDLLYFESLGRVSDGSLEAWAQRALRLYEEPGGLKDFQLEMPLTVIDVAGQTGLSCGYSYLDERDNQLLEYRVFLILPGGRGFSIALSTGDAWLEDGSPLEDILRQWRWLF